MILVFGTVCLDRVRRVPSLPPPGGYVEVTSEVSLLGGEGWVSEEALAIAVLCVARYPQDFLAAIRAAVNHSGDSDSTGAIAGNLAAAHLGMSNLPEDLLKELELRFLIEEIAEDLIVVQFPGDGDTDRLKARYKL